MHEATVNPWVALAYLIAGVCFILALRGLSSPVSSQRGNRFGMAGMLIAVVTTLVTHFPRLRSECQLGQFCFDDLAGLPDWASFGEILIAIAIGAIIGITIARRIAMTAMPELVAAFHSLVGLAAARPLIASAGSRRLSELSAALDAALTLVQECLAVRARAM